MRDSPLKLVSNDASPFGGGTTAGFVFEALFLRGMDTPPDLQLALSGIGIELDQLDARYPSAVWTAAIDLARSYLALDGSDADSTERRLGRACFAGVLRTVSGRLLAAAIPLMTPRSLLSRVGLYMRMGRDDLSVEFDDEGEALVLRVTDPASARPQVFAGLLEAALEQLGARYAMTVHPLDEQHFEVRVQLLTGG